MIVKSEFQIDLLVFNKVSDTEGLLSNLSHKAGVDVWQHITKLFPYVKHEERSFKGDRDYLNPIYCQYTKPVDIYRTEFFILGREDHLSLIRIFESITDPVLKQTALSILNK